MVPCNQFFSWSVVLVLVRVCQFVQRCPFTKFLHCHFLKSSDWLQFQILAKLVLPIFLGRKFIFGSDSKICSVRLKIQTLPSANSNLLVFMFTFGRASGAHQILHSELKLKLIFQIVTVKINEGIFIQIWKHQFFAQYSK